MSEIIMDFRKPNSRWQEVFAMACDVKHGRGDAHALAHLVLRAIESDPNIPRMSHRTVTRDGTPMLCYSEID